MILFKRLFALTFILPAAATGNSDTVNERIPVGKVELEAHWEVDCVASWTRLLADTANFSANSRCVLSADLTRQLQLCAFIYQPPGEPDSGHCPDYRGAIRTPERGDCQQLKKIVEISTSCEI